VIRPKSKRKIGTGVNSWDGHVSGNYVFRLIVLKDQETIIVNLASRFAQPSSCDQMSDSRRLFHSCTILHREMDRKGPGERAHPVPTGLDLLRSRAVINAGSRRLKAYSEVIPVVCKTGATPVGGGGGGGGGGKLGVRYKETPVL